MEIKVWYFSSSNIDFREFITSNESKFAKNIKIINKKIPMIPGRK